MLPVPSTLLSLTFTLLLHLTHLPRPVSADVQPFTIYDNVFIPPDYVAARNFSPALGGSQETIRQWANLTVQTAPWTVTSKPIVAPSGDKKDYMSWAPYWWPNCTGVGNTTVLSPYQEWLTCPYYQIDGDFNPYRLTVDDIGAFSNVSDAVLYNALAYSFENTSASNIYSQRIVKIIDTWFLDNTTGMNPNLNYAQMEGGPKGQVGTHTGVLDLHCIVKVVTGILVLRKLEAVDWTADLDSRMKAWTTQYLTWLETNTLGIQECASLNNHGSWCFNQVISLKILVGDTAGAVNSSQTFFQGIYQGQINSTGDQTNAQLYKYADPSANPWSIKTKAGTTIQDAMDQTMTVNYNTSGEADDIAEIYPNIAAIAATYGDPSGKYVAFLEKGFPEYAWDADFFWNQPLAGSALVDAGAAANGTNGAAAPGKSGAVRTRRLGNVVAAGWVVLSAFVMLL